MSVCRSQALINAPPSKVWDLVGDPRRHPEWWPRVVEVRGERFDEGSNYAQVTREPLGESRRRSRSSASMTCARSGMRCPNTGTYARWLLTEAQGNTFVDVEFGMDPIGLRYRIFDATMGKLYFRRWLEQSLAALQEVADEPDPKAA